ncbi:MAG: hypothetical protein WAW80_01495 [Candidatus Saccharimonadales bacterium]
MKRLFGKKGGTTLPRRRQQESHESFKQHEEHETVVASLFRRNRTLTGSSSSSISSATELNAGADLKSPRAHAHHLASHRRRLGTMLLFVVVVTGCLTWLLYEFTASIHVSATNSGIAIDSSRYQAVISSYLNIHPIERLRTALNKDQFADYVMQHVPEVSMITSNGASGFATGQFDITFREPIASWQIGSKQYFVDKTGVSYQVNYFDSPVVKIVDQSGVPQVAGTAIASSRFLQFVGRTVDVAKSFGLTVEQATIPSGTTRQIEIKVVGHTYPIKLSLDRSVGEQVEDMDRAIRFFDAKGQTPQYIDVRVSGRAFYK